MLAKQGRMTGDHSAHHFISQRVAKFALPSGRINPA